MFSKQLILAVACAIGVSSSPLSARQEEAAPVIAKATYDGVCYYPQADVDDFDLESYLGRWYQVAGTVAPFTAGCKCIFAQYGLNDNGTVSVFNSCQASDTEVTIQGTATPADAIYGETGVLRVQFPFQPPPDCPGPNYIVQKYETDWAIVQASNFTTLFLLSREQNPPQSEIDAWLEQARRLGSDLSNVITTDQSGCLFTG